ncbi:MAG TPA: cytochrome c peroxidase [Cyclobacteriaceae bacterium]
MAVRTLPRYSTCLIVLTLVISCQDDFQVQSTGEIYLDLPTERYQYNNFADSTNAISTLGRVLFYDRNLSLNNTVACASCHKQEFGFADNKQFSPGFGGQVTTRNSMPVQNLQAGNFAMLFDVKIGSTFFAPGQGHLFWDGRESSLEKLVLQPIGNHIEMGIPDAQTLTSKLSVLPYYSSLFNDAFKSTQINSDRVATAISTFCNNINTTNTRFDKFTFSRFATVDVAAPTSDLNSLELEGMLLFEQKYDCNSCHGVQTTNGYIFNGTFANIGLDANNEDLGRAKVTGIAGDAGKFKIPSLRNVVYTAPYMHDGRFATLEDVIDHYSDGIEDNPNLDPKLTDGAGHARNMNISEHEKQAIIAFLHTLSDKSVLTDPKFSDPFKVK